MAEPVSIRLRLGFEDVDAFVRGYWRAAEAGTLFLATTRPQEAGALVRFELVSRKGERLFLAEGRVISVTPEGGASAPGMRLKLTRLNAEGKEIYERMLAQRPANQRSATAGGGPGMRAGTLPPGTARATTAGRTDAIEAIAEDLDSLLGGARTSTPSPAPAAPDPHEGRSISLEEATRLLDSISSPTPAHPEKAPPPTSSPPAPSPPASPPPVAARPTPPELRPSPPGRPSPPPATAVAPPPPPPPPAEPPAPPPWAKLRGARTSPGSTPSPAPPSGALEGSGGLYPDGRPSIAPGERVDRPFQREEQPGRTTSEKLPGPFPGAARLFIPPPPPEPTRSPTLEQDRLPSASFLRAPTPRPALRVPDESELEAAIAALIASDAELPEVTTAGPASLAGARPPSPHPATVELHAAEPADQEPLLRPSVVEPREPTPPPRGVERDSLPEKPAGGLRTASPLPQSATTADAEGVWDRMKRWLGLGQARPGPHPPRRAPLPALAQLLPQPGEDPLARDPEAAGEALALLAGEELAEIPLLPSSALCPADEPVLPAPEPGAP